MQWIIDIMTEWAAAQGYLTTGFVDRGDPSVNDFDVNDFTKNGAWHELDLSSIVPAGAQAVALTAYMQADSVGAVFQTRRGGNTGIRTVSWLFTPGANISTGGDITCAVDADRKISYRASPIYDAVYSVLNMTVKGWWL